ncbi:MAG: PASTA domain-containing protein [Streptosporangiaceae bacterium]
MTSIVTWYDVLGVLPDATPGDIQAGWQARRAALAPGLLTGAPPDVRAAAGRAVALVDEARRVLGDPATRGPYDAGAGVTRPGEGLEPPGAGPTGPDVTLGQRWTTADEEALRDPPVRPSHVLAPDVGGLFYHACLEVAGRLGLHVAPVRLTAHPMPVEGLVVAQTPAPGHRVHAGSTLTVQLWHPPEPDR